MIPARLALACSGVLVVLAFAAGFHEGRTYERESLLEGTPSLRRWLSRLSGGHR